ncbi:MAG: T9SS type A sorting domain-containing protein [bacterium]
MKTQTNYLIIVVFMLNFLNLTAQVNVKNYPQLSDYYPYHVNDIWLYYDTGTGEAINKKVTKIDTSIADNCHYIYYNNCPSWSDKVVLDSGLVYFVAYSKPLYRFNIPLGTYWTIIENEFFMRYVYDYPEHYVFTKYIDCIAINHFYWREPDSTAYASTSGDIFAKNIGLYSYWWEGGERTLLGCIINSVEYGILIDVADDLTPIDYKVTIKNYPNPFNNQTIIKYTIPEAEFVNITMYDMLGRELEVLKNEYQNAGAFSIPWTAKGLSSGVYFAVIKYKNQMLTHKIIYQK